MTAVPNFVRNLLGSSVVDRAVGVPGFEDGFDGKGELLEWIAREFTACMLSNMGEEFVAHDLEVVGVEVEVGF